MEELLGRRTPYSATAEQSVIGSMLIDARCIPEVIDKVKSAGLLYTGEPGDI